MHEGPARISKLGSAALKRGMILSNEPGYYRTGAYGIRIENLILVTEAAAVADAEKPLNAFETLTLAPIDARLIEPRCLTAEEIAWLDAYHARVREALAPLVDAPTRDWLMTATTLPTLMIFRDAMLKWEAHRMSFTHSSSVSTATPSFFASASFEPAPGPATT